MCVNLIEEKGLSNLHIALKNEFPLPENTLKDLVRDVFKIDDLDLSEDDGFTIIDIESDGFPGERVEQYYVDQTQDYYLISRNQYGKNEPESYKRTGIQANFNYNADKELINQIKIQLNLNRLDYLLNFNQNCLIQPIHILMPG